MSYLLEEELTSQGVSTKTTLKIRFNNKIYVRVKTLPMQFYERAKKIKEQYTIQNIDSLLIEHQTWIAIWIEEFNRLNEIENDYLYRMQDSYSPLKDTNFQLTKGQGISNLDERDSFPPQDLEINPTYQKYRGITYHKDNILDSCDPITESQKFTRKYRGIAYQNEVSDHISDISDDVTPLEEGKRKYRGRSY